MGAEWERRRCAWLGDLRGLLELKLELGGLRDLLELEMDVVSHLLLDVILLLCVDDLHILLHTTESHKHYPAAI